MSKIWVVFNKIPYDDSAVNCSLCARSLSYKHGSTKNLWEHLRRWHTPHFERLREGKAAEQIDGDSENYGEGEQGNYPLGADGAINNSASSNATDQKPHSTRKMQKAKARRSIKQQLDDEPWIPGMSPKGTSYHRYQRRSFPAYSYYQQPSPPTDRFACFGGFVEGAVRDMHSQSAETSSQMMQAIYATIANYQMQQPPSAPSTSATIINNNMGPTNGVQIQQHSAGPSHIEHV